ncbi:MAG: rhodanese-like domain-containing protein [Hellea sp.]
MDLLVTADWLGLNLGRNDVKVLDGTWVMPGEPNPLEGQYIPGASIFDVDAIADLTSSMKHMLPSANTFTSEVSKMGLSNTDHIVVYDRHGFRAAPRVWWTFRMFGHRNISILDGGLPAWIKAGHDISSKPAQQKTRTDYKPQAPLSGAISKDEIIALLPSGPQIVDARSTGRFYGTAPEPRAGLRSGHIPGSLSLPFTQTRTSEMHLKGLAELAEMVGGAGIDLSKPIITSCGSGITAAALAFIFYRLGAEDIRLYDGSWTEWGASGAAIEI